MSGAFPILDLPILESEDSLPFEVVVVVVGLISRDLITALSNLCNDTRSESRYMIVCDRNPIKYKHQRQLFSLVVMVLKE